MAHGERAAAKSNYRKEYWTSRPPNHGGGQRGPCRAAVQRKALTHRLERARAKEELRRDAKAGFERDM
ncbi:MAG: hypothetical protein ABL982_11065 [Vicinamibacterales bacterium]